MGSYKPEICGCDCFSLRDISISNDDLLFAVNLMGATKLSKAPEHARTLVQTNRYQRRELTRNGVSYREIQTIQGRKS